MSQPSPWILLTCLAAILIAAVAAAPAAAATLVVANKAEATVSLIDLGSGKVAATLPTGEGPHEVAVSPSGKLALVTNYGTREKPGSSLTLLDVPGAKVVRTVDLGEYRRPHGAVWLSESRALVTAEGNQALLEVDLAEGKVVRAIPTGQETSHMVVVAAGGSSGGGRAFVANIGSGSITVIDLKEGRKIGDVPTGKGAEGIDATPDGKQVWVTNREADTVSVVDAASLEVVATVPSAAFPIRAKATPDGRRVLISNAKSGDIAVLSVGDRKEERRIALAVAATVTEGRLLGFGTSSVPIGIVVEPGGKRAWVAHANADRITVLDLATWQPAGSLTAGKEPDGMGYSPLPPGKAKPTG